MEQKYYKWEENAQIVLTGKEWEAITKLSQMFGMFSTLINGKMRELIEAGIVTEMELPEENKE